MVDLINILNRTGDGFCKFALAMFIQSGILIVLLYLIDLLIRKYVRAVFRYCIWMLVFVKLILPPALCLPTGIGYWCGLDIGSANREVSTDIQAKVTAENLPPASKVFDQPVITEVPAITNNDTYMPPPVKSSGLETASVAAGNSNISITWQAVAFLIWLVGILVLSVLLFQRFLFVKSLLAQSDKANGRLNEALQQYCQQVGICRNIELRLSKNMLSPAACGLFKPVILMPVSLLENLSREKLRAVLIHELAHIKRGDLWVNFIQTVLQIVYFYNPLLWFANAVVRGIREKAVDEMVLTRLGDEAKSYSSTLIDIAEIAFSRPHFSLRLVGVVESKKALSGRIKHILNRPFPKTTKLSLAGLMVIVVFATVLLPMSKSTSKPPEFVIRGKVTDSKTGQPIAGVKVGDNKEYNEGKFCTVTDSNGNYEYKTWYEEHGTTAQADGYKSQLKGFGTKLFGSEKEKVIDFVLVQGLDEGNGEILDDADVTGQGWEIAWRGKELIKSHGPIYSIYVRSINETKEGVELNVGIVFSRLQEIPQQFRVIAIDNNEKIRLCNSKITVKEDDKYKTYTFYAPFKNIALKDIKEFQLQFKYSEKSNLFDKKNEADSDGWITKWHGDRKHIMIADMPDGSIGVGRIVENNGIVEIDMYDTYYKDHECRIIAISKWWGKTYIGNITSEIKPDKGARFHKAIFNDISLDKIKEFRFQIRPIKNNSFKANLPNGVTVELIGISYIPVKGSPWWAPDGNPMKPLFDSASCKPEKDPNNQFNKYAITVRVDGISEKEIRSSLIMWRIAGASKYSGTTSAYENNVPVPANLCVAVASMVPQELKTTDVEIGLAVGEWKTIASGIHREFYEIGNDTVIISEPFQALHRGWDDNTLVFGVTYTITHETNRDFRIAIEKDGKLYEGQRHGSAGNAKLRKCNISFPGLEREAGGLKKYLIQSRPYEWVTFKNVSLKPNFKSDVQVEVQNSAGQGENSNGENKNEFKATLPNGVTANNIKKAVTNIRIVDEDGNPIAGAVITIDGVGNSLSGHRLWTTDSYGPAPEVTTNAQGSAEVSYPIYVYEKSKTEELSFRVNHPEFCPARPFWRVDGGSSPVVLKKGATVKVSAYTGSKDKVVKEFFPQVSYNEVMFDTSYWGKNDDGTFTTRQISSGPHYLRAVYLPKNNRIHFSDFTYFEAEKGKTYVFDLELKPGVRVEGELDGSVPRPIKNGYIVAVCDLPDSKKEAGFLFWQISRDIKEDGTFVVESLPPGQADIIAICDGFVSKDPKKLKARIRNPQIFTLVGNTTQVEILMEPAAVCEVRVVDGNNNPIPNARVSFFPNVVWPGGKAQIFAGRSRPLGTEEFVASGGKFDFSKFNIMEENYFSATTDINGVAIVKNLPPQEQHFGVTHPDYEMPIQKWSYGERRTEKVNLSSGKTTFVTVKMQKKGTEFLGTQTPNSPAAAGPKQSQDVMTCGLDRDDSIGTRDPSNDQKAFEGIVVDETGKPIEGVLVDAWTWYPGNETTTDANGHFKLAGFKDTKRIEVRFSKEKYSPCLIVRQQLGVRNAVVILNSRTYFEGKVLDVNGHPVANALIRAAQGPKHADGVMIGEIWTETHTNQTGNYRLYVQPDIYDIRVNTPGVGVARLSKMAIELNQAKSLDITLRPACIFRAKVIDSITGKPAAGVRLFNWFIKDVEGSSDTNGLVIIPGMLPGRFQFDVKSKDYARWWSQQCLSEWSRFMIDDKKTGWQRNFDYLDFEIKDDMSPVTIIVEKGVRIRGRIVDPNGNSIGGATAAPARTGSGNSLTGDTRFSVTTKPDGTFEMLLPASGKCQYNLVAHDGKYNEWRKWANGVMEPIHTKPGEELNNIVLRLTQPATVKGTVVNPSGMPVADRQVRAHALDKLENRYYDPTTKTDQNGNFELNFIRAGEQCIQVAPFWLKAEEAPEGSSKIVTAKPGEIIEAVKLVADNTK